MMSRVIASALLIFAGGIARAQVAVPGAYVIETQIRERRLNGRQQPRFTPFTERTRVIVIDSMRRTDLAREWVLTIDPRSMTTSATIDATLDGRVQRLTATAVRRSGRIPFLSAKDSIRFSRFPLFELNGALSLPATKAWDVVPSFRPSRLVAGASWRDTIVLATDVDGNRQALRGERTSTLVRDTVVDGKPLWLVRDSAAVRYDERALIEERTLDTLVTVARSTAGTLCGSMLYDPALGLARQRDDTLTLAGTAELRYPDGRSFRTAASDDRTRHWVLYDSTAYAARQRAQFAEMQRTRPGGVVIVPTNPIDERLSRGDTVVRDSLVRAWRAASEPNERAELYRRLTFWEHTDTAFVHRLEAARIAEGDSAFMLEWLADRPYIARIADLDVATMRRLIDVMAQPGLPFAFGVDRDKFYEDMSQALTTTPPAITPDTTRWPCAPMACRLLADQWGVATEPRLKQVALVAHFVLDPRQWKDTVERFATRPPPLLAASLFLAHGVGSTANASSRAPIPPSDADWRAWLEWMSGVDPAFARWRQAALPMQAAVAPRLAFTGFNVLAIRFTEVLTGRDIVSELRDHLARATSDSARVLYQYVLNALGAYTPTVASVTALLRSSAPAERAMGMREIVQLFAGHPPRADSLTTDSLQDVLIATALEHHGGRWRMLDAEPNGAPRVALGPPRETNAETMLLLADSISPGLRAKWAEHVSLITMADWKRRPLRTGGTLLTLTSVARVGPFAKLGVRSTGRIARNPDQAPWLYDAETTYYLMQIGGEWVVVATEAMIT